MGVTHVILLIIPHLQIILLQVQNIEMGLPSIDLKKTSKLLMSRDLPMTNRDQHHHRNHHNSTTTTRPDLHINFALTRKDATQKLFAITYYDAITISV